MNGTMALVVDQAGATLEAGTHDTLVLIHADGRRERVGLRALGSVVLHGDVKLSTGVLQKLAANDIALSILARCGRSPTAGFGFIPSSRAAMRHLQHLAYADDDRRLVLARIVVLAKLETPAALPAIMRR